MSKQQTAVEWLVEQIKSDQNQKALSVSEWTQIINQAKKMEKNQMKKTWQDGFSFQSPYKNFEQYYNETYGKSTNRS